MKTLYYCAHLFVDGDGKGNLILRSDYQARWNAAQPTLQPFIANGTIFGFFLGDELIWNGQGLLDLMVIWTQVCRMRTW